MKKCPACNRTYSDETLSFCLEDGSLLSAPYDLHEGQQTVLRANRTEPAPTQFYPVASEYNEIPTVISAKNANLDYVRPVNAQNSPNQQEGAEPPSFSTGEMFARYSLKVFLLILFVSILAAVYTASVIPLGFGLFAVLFYLAWKK